MWTVSGGSCTELWQKNADILNIRDIWRTSTPSLTRKSGDRTREHRSDDREYTGVQLRDYVPIFEAISCGFTSALVSSDLWHTIPCYCMSMVGRGLMMRNHPSEHTSQGYGNIITCLRASSVSLMRLCASPG